MLDQTISIAGQFQEVTYGQWKETVAQMLGAQVEEKLILQSIEQIELNPLSYQSDRVVDLHSFPVNVETTECEIEESSESIDAAKIHNAGGSIIQEVSYILDQYTKKRGQQRCQIHLACDSFYFSNIAKLRAIRFCLERIQEDYSDTPQFELIAHNSLREQSLFDPWVNMLRSTASSMAAIIGGANKISSLSYDHLHAFLTEENESALGRRQADNILKILLKESHLASVQDPMKGSYTVDNLTYQIINKAWEKLIEGVDLKKLPQQVEQMAQKRYQLVQTRKWTVTGINNYANADETLASIYKSDRKINWAQQGDYPLRRPADEFEKLRLKVEGKKITIFLALFGSEAKLSARANFCKNYFELLGVKVITSKASTDESNLVEQFKQACANYTIVCAQDSDYPEHGQKLIDRYKEAGAKLIYLAGKPRDLELAGLRNNLYMGQNIYDVLEDFVGEVLA